MDVRSTPTFMQALLLRLLRGFLKRHLTTAALVEASTLPCDLKVIEEWRKSGGRIALVTASDQRLAQAIADYLGICDEVHGSDGSLNLKGETKGR